MGSMSLMRIPACAVLTRPRLCLPSDHPLLSTRKQAETVVKASRGFAESKFTGRLKRATNHFVDFRPESRFRRVSDEGGHAT
jgi:hypothetical protein